MSAHEDDNITETLFFPISNLLFSSNAGVAPKNRKHPEKSAKSYYCYHRNHKVYFNEEVRRYLEQRGMDLRPRDSGLSPGVDDLRQTVPDLDVASGVAATTSSSSSRVTGAHNRPSFNPRSQLQRRRRDQDYESDMIGLRSKRLRTMDVDGVTDPVEFNMGSAGTNNITATGDRMTPVWRRDTPGAAVTPPPPAQRAFSNEVQVRLPGHPKTIRTEVHQVGSKSRDDSVDDSSACHTFISVKYGF